MAKIMIFIDGTWLYSNTPKLSEAYGDKNFHVDFGKLPQVLAEEVVTKLGSSEIDVVRTYLFGSYATNYDLCDEDSVNRRREFFDMLKEEYHYEVEIFPINFLGRRLRRFDRDPKDTFEPKEKCVDIALATTMLYLAAIPYAYDIAIAVIGDKDFTPMLKNVRRLGKRVAIASIKKSCTPEFADPRDEARVKDFDIISLDDLLHKLVLKFEKHQQKCESPTHKGNPIVWTTFHPRKGKPFFCDVCRDEFQNQKRELQREFVSSRAESIGESQYGNCNNFKTQLSGVILKIMTQGYGFIKAEDDKQYYFHMTDLMGITFDTLKEGQQVNFEVKKNPSDDKAGAAQKVYIQVQ
jgi:cold shock CspA family protein/uncharacterized LabA/DUF88 family protein